MDELFTFENLLIMLLVAIIFMLVMKVNDCGNDNYESFNLKKDMELNESKHVLASDTFDLSCCDSPYTNDRGCLCGEAKINEMIRTRGMNHHSLCTQPNYFSSH